MKHTLLNVLAGLLVFVGPSVAEERTHFYDFLKIEVQEVLDIYQQVSGLDLVTDSGVAMVSSLPIRLHFERRVSTNEAARLLENILAQEAGVVVTRLDSKLAMVTHDGGRPSNRQGPRPDSAQMKEQVKFISDVRRAFETHDASLLDALTTWEEVPDFFADRLKRQDQKMAACTMAQLRLSACNPKHVDENGVRLRTSLPITWQLKMTFAEPCGFLELPPDMGMRLSHAVWTHRSVGEKDGQLYMLVYLPSQ